MFIRKYGLKRLFIIITVSSSFFFSTQDSSSLEEESVNNRDFFLTSRDTKQKYVSFGKMATIDEVCDLLNHPIFYSVDLPKQEDMFENEYEKFFRQKQKFLEVPIDSIIDEFQSKIPFGSKKDVEFLVGRSPNEHYAFWNDLEETFMPNGDYRFRTLLGNENCLPPLVTLGMSRLYAIEWWSDSQKYNVRGNGGQYDKYARPDEPCLFCIFFIKDFHLELNNRFDAILAGESFLREQLQKEAEELKIRNKSDRGDKSLNNQSFRIAAEINAFKRKIELENLIEELSQVMNHELVSNANASRMKDSKKISIISSVDYLDERTFDRKKKRLEEDIIYYKDLIENKKERSKRKKQLEDLLKELKPLILEYSSLTGRSPIIPEINESDYNYSEKNFIKERNELENQISRYQSLIKSKIAEDLRLQEIERVSQERAAKKLQAQEEEKRRLAAEIEERELQERLKQERDRRIDAIYLSFDILFIVFVIFQTVVSRIGIKGLRENLKSEKINEKLKAVKLSLIEIIKSILSYFRSIFIELRNWIYPDNDSDNEEINTDNDDVNQDDRDEKKSERQNKKRSSKRTQSNKSKSYYEILEVSRNASQAEIKKAYQRLAMKYHPDRNKAKNAAEIFKQIQNAYQTLSDLKAKSKYDKGY